MFVCCAVCFASSLYNGGCAGGCAGHQIISDLRLPKCSGISDVYDMKCVHDQHTICDDLDLVILENMANLRYSIVQTMLHQRVLQNLQELCVKMGWASLMSYFIGGIVGHADDEI